jgi:hypothetical protein
MRIVEFTFENMQFIERCIAVIVLLVMFLPLIIAIITKT